MRIENLSLKSVYFDAINRGVKTVEYRDMTPYYINKFVDKSHYQGLDDNEIIEKIRKEGKAHFLPLDGLRFHNNGRILTMEVVGIEVYDGHTTFAIKLGKRLKY